VPVPKPPEAFRSYAQSFTNDLWLRRAGPLEALEISRPFASALDTYEEQLVREARNQGCTWGEIGQALGVTRQGARKQFHHVESQFPADFPLRPRQTAARSGSSSARRARLTQGMPIRAIDSSAEAV